MTSLSWALENEHDALGSLVWAVMGPVGRTGLQLSSARRHPGGVAIGRPVAFGIALIIVWWAITLLLATALPRSSPWLPDLGSKLVNLGALLVPLAIVVAFDWWRQAGLALPRPNQSWWTLLPLVFFALSFTAGGLSGSPAQFFGSAVLFLALGLNEELLFRGVIQHATTALGVVRSVVWVALLFGLQHAYKVGPRLGKRNGCLSRSAAIPLTTIALAEAANKCRASPAVPNRSTSLLCKP